MCVMCMQCQKRALVLAAQPGSFARASALDHCTTFPALSHTFCELKEPSFVMLDLMWFPPFKLMAKLTRQLKYYFVSSPKNKKIQYGYQNKAGPGNSGLLLWFLGG